MSCGRLLRTVGMAGHRPNVSVIGTSVDALPNSGNMQDQVPSTVVATHVTSFPSRIPASSTVLREVHPSPHGRCSVLSDTVDSEPENRVDPTVLDSVEGVVDHRRMPDTDSDSTESVHSVDEVLSDVEAFREEIDVEEVKVPLPRWPRRMFGDGLWSLDGVDIRQIFQRRALVMKSVQSSCKGLFRAVLKAIMEEQIGSGCLASESSLESFCCLDCCCISHHVEVSFRRSVGRTLGVVCPWQLVWHC